MRVRTLTTLVATVIALSAVVTSCHQRSVRVSKCQDIDTVEAALTAPGSNEINAAMVRFNARLARHEAGCAR